MSVNIPSIKNYIKEADYPEDLFVKYANVPRGPAWLISTRVRRLDGIINELKKNAFLPEIKIFGSAADSPDKLPNDIDVFVDTSKIKLDTHIFKQSAAHLLSISRHYKNMLDPFILHNGKLWTRNPDSTKWIKAKNNDSIIKSGKRGIPLTLFDKNFTVIAQKALSENKNNSQLKDIITKIENSKQPTVMFEGYEISEKMFKEFTPMQIAMILGGH